MALNFPPNPPNGETWQPKPNPHNLVFEYDEQTNSWNIVGPDNIATTDYVDGKLSDSTSDVVRNYHLHTSVNSVSITANYIYNYSDTNTGNPYDSGDDINRTTHCDYIFSSGVQGRVQIEKQDPFDAIADEIDDWHKCMESHTQNGQFKVVGVDVENGCTLSFKYKHICGFNFTAKDQDGQPTNWLEEANIGDVIEVNYESGVSGNPRYAIYKILNIQELTTYAEPVYGVSVQFMESATPDTEFRTNPSNTYYEFRNYLQPLNSGGGTLSGDLKIVSDSNQAFSVWRNEDPVNTQNPHALVLKVDTTENKILGSDEYDRALRNPTHVDNGLLVTLNHLNKRLGIDDPIYSTADNGPFLPLRGGTLTGPLTIKRSSASQVFVIEGKNTSGNIINLFYVYKNSGGDSVRYYGKISSNNDIVYKKYVDDKVKNLSDQVSNANYLKKQDSSNDNKMLASLNFGGQQGINLNTPESDSVAKDTDAANCKFVRDRMDGKIFNGHITTEGKLYTVNGCLYFNTYR